MNYVLPISVRSGYGTRRRQHQEHFIIKNIGFYLELQIKTILPLVQVVIDLVV